MGPKPKEPVPVIIPDVVDPPIGGQPGPQGEEKTLPSPTTIYKPSESMAPLI